MEEEDGFGLRIGGVTEVEDVTVRAQAADDGGAGWCVEGVALVADGDFAVVTDADARLLAPDVGPPRTSWSWAQDRPFFGQSLAEGSLRGCA